MMDYIEKMAPGRVEVNGRNTESRMLRTRYIFAGHPETPEYVLVELARDRSVHIRRNVAENSMAPIGILEELAGDESSEVRLAVAENPSTPRILLECLAQDECDDVRFGLAESSNTPPEILRFLCKDVNPYIADRAERTLEVVTYFGDFCRAS